MEERGKRRRRARKTRGRAVHGGSPVVVDDGTRGGALAPRRRYTI